MELRLFELPGRQAGQNQKPFSIVDCHLKRRDLLVPRQRLT
jgi:hypothetical protein